MKRCNVVNTRSGCSLACSAIHCLLVYVFVELIVSSSVAFQWFCPCGHRLPSDGSRRSRFPAVSSTMRSLRLPALLPLGLLIHQPVPRCACLFAPSPPQAGAGPDPLFRPGVHPAFRRGQCRTSQVPRRALPWLCGRSLTPDDPWRLALGGASGAAPAITKTKASTLRISRLNSVASPPAVYASRRALPHAMQHALPAGWLAFAGQVSNLLARGARFQLIASSLPGLALAQCSSPTFRRHRCAPWDRATSAGSRNWSGLLS